MLYVVATDEHGVVVPVIAPGVPIAPLTVMAKVDAVDDPQALLAVTLTLPEVALVVVVILVVVDVPVQPPGNVQV